MAEREQLLADFVGWARKHITGDEKGQAQIFLDRLFQAFGHPGPLDVGGMQQELTAMLGRTVDLETWGFISESIRLRVRRDSKVRYAA